MKKYFKKFQKIPSRWKFLLAVLLVYFFVALVDFSVTKNAFLEFLVTLEGILKILFLVFGVMFLVDLFVRPETIRKHLGEDSGAKGWLYAMFGSIFISGPPYILFPFLGELKRQGVKDALLVAFLNNRNVQPTFIPVMIFYFGMPFTIIVSIYILLFAFINGQIAGKILKNKSL